MATETDGTVEVLKEIRDELRNVRTELLEQMRRGRTGVRTERFDRASRWRMATMAGTGAVAFVALVVALRAGHQPTTVVMPAPLVATAAPAPSPAVTPAPVATAPAAPAAKPVAPKVALKLATATPASPSTTPTTKKHAKPAVPKPAVERADGDDDETMAFSPPPKRVRVHKMSYGPVESEPAKL